MKLNIQTKTEKNNFIGLLIAGNFLGTTTCFVLLILQFWYFPEFFALTWAFTLAVIIAMAYFNLRYFRALYNFKMLWQWLKNHQ